MDRKLGRVISMCFLLAAPLLAHAQNKPSDWKYGNVTVYGVANESCGAYIESRRTPTTTQSYGYASFVGGYLTAYGTDKGRNFPSSISGILVWLENYCQKNPEQDFLFALGAYTSSH